MAGNKINSGTANCPFGASRVLLCSRIICQAAVPSREAKAASLNHRRIAAARAAASSGGTGSDSPAAGKKFRRAPLTRIQKYG